MRRCLLFCLFVLAGSAFAHAQTFYPLAIGNRWDYYSIGYALPMDPTMPAVRDTFSVIVVDTATIGGRLWHQLNRADLTGIMSAVCCVRTDAHGVYYLWATDSTEHHVFRVDSALGSSWQLFPGHGSITVDYRSNDTAEHFGVRSEERRFTLDGLIAHDVVLAENIGIVYGWFGGEPPGTYREETFLSGCIIDGVTRGKLLSSPPPPVALARWSLPVSIYPNPARGRATIACDAAPAARVCVEVYDALGRCVLQSTGEESAIARRTFTWDAGAHSAGVYLVRMTAGDATGSARLLSLRP
jgi:hypothetical protein